MRRLNSGLLWLVIAALAFAAILAFGPSSASAQTSQDPSHSCLGGAKIPLPPKDNVNNGLRLITNLNEKDIDIAIIKTPGADGYLMKADEILTKHLTLYKQPGIRNLVQVGTVADAITEINNVYNATNPRRKLNVLIVGHGSPGRVEVGADIISNQNAPMPNINVWRTNQKTFINALVGRIEHLKFLSCSTAADQGFMNKMRVDLDAARVSGFTDIVWAFGPFPWPNSAQYPYNDSYRQFLNQLAVQLPGDKKNVVGGIVVDPDTGALALQSESSSSSDAWLLAEVIAGTAAAAFVLGGGAWYVRRRRMP